MYGALPMPHFPALLADDNDGDAVAADGAACLFVCLSICRIAVD